MPGCAAVNCSNSAKKRFIMKHFPRDPVRRKEWLIKMRRDKWIPTDYSCLCEVHFSSEMWEKAREDGTRKLKANAVPTVFSFSQPKKPRKPPVKRKLSSLKAVKVMTGTRPIYNDVKLPVGIKEPIFNLTNSELNSCMWLYTSKYNENFKNM
nr:unnamed protein product [Callosobruchus analis]